MHLCGVHKKYLQPRPQELTALKTGKYRLFLISKRHPRKQRINQGGGGLYGDSEDLRIYPQGNSKIKISLAGDWKYLPVSEFHNKSFYLFDVESQEFYQKPKLEVPFSQYTPCFLYNGMLNPIVPYTIKGVIWYQGEANVRDPKLYEKSFPLFIESLRKKWNNDSLPFYYVQIAPWNYTDGQSQYLRDVQRKTLKLNNTGMAVTLDIGDDVSIHPAYKKEVGRRLALWTLSKDYNKNYVYSGPLYKGMEIKGDKVFLSFDVTGSGLSSPQKKLSYFKIAGKDSLFVDAKAIIEDNRVVVWNPAIKNPVAVRYSWANLSHASLFNKEGLPASTFRTDDWNK